MKRFSKNDNQAICNYCGKWQPTDLTPQQLEEMDWKCDECKAKEPQQAAAPTDQERGSKEISKYDPEYTFLVKLVKLLVQEGVSPQEIKAIADAYPFVTVDDVGDLTAKLWTLATTKYQIPREWLIKRLPKNASLKTAGQITQLFDTKVYTNPNLNQILNALQSSEFNGLRYLLEKNGTIYVWDAAAAVHEDMGRGLGLAEESTQDAGYIENSTDAQYVLHKALDSRQELLTKASLDKEAADEGFWIDPSGKTFKIRDDSTDYQTHNDWIHKNMQMLKNEYSIDLTQFQNLDIKDQNNILIDAGWVRIGDSNKGDIGMRVKDLRHIPAVAENVLFSFYKGGNIAVEDLNGRTVQIARLEEDLQSAVNDQLRMAHASLKAFSKADLWRGQEEADDMINHAPGYLAYEYGQDKTADGEFTGAEFSTDDVGVNPTLDSGPFSSPEDHGAKPQKQPFPNTGWLPADDENKDEQPYSNVAASLEKEAYLDHAYWIDPKGEVFEVRGAEGNESDYTHANWIMDNQKTLEKRYGIYGAEDRADLISEGWVRIGDSSTNNWMVEIADLKKVPSTIDLVLVQFASENAKIDFEDLNGNFVQAIWPWQNIQSAVNRAVRMQLSNAAKLKRPFSKKAGLDGRYWIAPDGKEFNAGTHHGAWVKNHPDVLKAYGLNTGKNISYEYDQMFNSGWTRVSNERGFTLQVADLKRLPKYLDDFIAKHFIDGDVIRIGSDAEMVQVSDPFPSLQKAVNKQLRYVRGSLKEADLSGQTVNEIVNLLQANGGVTYNISKGNMVGTDNYAVAIYPDRAEILPGAGFEVIEEYLLRNGDLLNDPENSFGAWSHDGKVYLDIVATLPDINKAVELGKQHNQIAIWDLKNAQQISTGGTGEVKQASQNPLLPQQLQDEVAAETSPIYNVALNNYAEAVKRGHEKDRSLKYAIESVANLEKIDPKKLVELINKYL